MPNNTHVTINVSKDQKQRILAVKELVSKHLPVKVSQADVVDMGMSLLEKEYGSK